MVSQFNYVTCPKCGHDRNPVTAKKCEICAFKLGKSFGLLPMIGGGLALLTLLGVGYFALKGQPGSVASAAGGSSSEPSSSQGFTDRIFAFSLPGISLPGNAAQSNDVSAFLSRGERVLFTDTPVPSKQAAATAFAAGDFPTAVRELEASRQASRSDPESLIYLNNARLGNTPALSVAVVVPIGSNANAAREILRGVAQAQDEANRAGVPLKVVIGDDNNDPKRAQDIANTLAKDSSILAVIGHGTSKTSLAAAPVYQQNQMVMVAPTSTSTELVQVPKSAGGDNYIFRTISSDQFTGTALARYMLKTLGKRKAAVFFNSGSSYSKSLEQAFETTLSLEGGQVVQQVDLAKGNAASQISGGAAEVLVLLPDSDTLAQAIEVAKANQNRLPLLAGDAVYKIDSLQQGGAALNGMVLPVPWHPLKNADPNFSQTASSLWGGDINWRTAMGYDAVRALRVGRAKGKITVQNGRQGRAALAKAFAAPGFASNGATGVISFLPSGDRNSNVILVKVQPGTRSGTGYDFVPLQ
ncbi:ABC transporter substrate-binding protein [Leptolyngbya sp. FACHB-261]|uniref:ABC transporter substrate-binding protein n=1 Tax=Leptolyngbya sp. FACHB-261 TaxID=2692806 RepID=UPI001687D51C|nr:ABC transporter substrate-binding protein [Leptolyngbya sp. FACHB-261]MBD2101773.1 amino acid ABC transporter substrate-binding protein [Leptolyngbya sp. FACHB-261]